MQTARNNKTNTNINCIWRPHVTRKGRVIYTVSAKIITIRGYCANTGHENEEYLSFRNKLAKAAREIKKEKKRLYGNEISEQGASEGQIEGFWMDVAIKTTREGGKDTDGFAAAAIIIQKGGTSRRASSQQEVTYGSARMTLGEIRDMCNGHKMTVRQLARACRDEIYEMIKGLDDEKLGGNLAKRFEREYPDATLEEKMWASDFQTDNPNCPERVRRWLINDYERRFSKQN